MRTLRLLRLAAEAEGLRLRRMARRMVFRAVYGVVAVLFLLFALCVLHAVIYLWLRPHVGPMHAVLIVLAIDLVITIIFGLLAASSAESRAEREAREVRNQAKDQMLRSVATFTVVPSLGRLLGQRHIYGLVLAALTAQFLGTPKRRR